MWCSTAGVLRLNTPAELLGLSGSIFVRKTAPSFCRKHTMRLVAILIALKTRCHNGAGHRGGNLGNKVIKTFPLFFSKLNRTA
jgi:hypothetical protein